MSCHNLRSWEFSKLYATGTPGWAKPRLLSELVGFITALMLSSILLPAAVSAAIDAASKVSVQVLARPGSASGAAQDFVVRDGGVLRTGDGVQLRIASETQAYVYVIAYGSSNRAILLHPFSARPEDALIDPGSADIIPGSGVFLPLDAQEGREALFTIVSEAPLKNIADLLPRIEAHGDNLSAISAMLEASYPHVRRLTFRHIGARPLVGFTTPPPRAGAEATASPATDAPTIGVAASQPGGGGSLLPPVDSGWSVPSPRGLGSSDTTPSLPASAAHGTVSAAAAGTAALEPQSGLEAASSPPASPALRRAREAAGIDERQFRGILSALPDSGADSAPESLRRARHEQGVLSAEGSRIPVVDTVRLRSSSGASVGADDPRNRSQN